MYNDTIRSSRIYTAVTAAHHSLVQMLPLHQNSKRALEEFVATAGRIHLAPFEWDAVLIPFLAAIDRNAERLPTLVDRYCSQIRSYGEAHVVRLFELLVDNILRYRGIGDPIVQKAIAFIEDRYADSSLTQKTVAQHLLVRPARLGNVFLRETGLTVVEYLRAVRLDRSARLLGSSSSSIKEVWASVGYNDASNFAHDFKHRFCASPSQYRSKAVQAMRIGTV